MKIPVVKVQILWSENDYFFRRYGDHARCIVQTLAEANALLRDMAISAPGPSGGYDKTGFRVTFADGGTYEGRYDLHRVDMEQENPNGRIDLGDHMLGELRFSAGMWKPDHLTEAQYKQMLRHVSTEQTAYATHAVENYQLS